MKLLMYGLDVHSMSEEEQQPFKAVEAAQQNILENAIRFKGVLEVYLLQDEDQFEVYLFIDETHFEHGDLLRYLAAYGGMDLKDIIFYSYSLYNEEAISHLFKKSYGSSQLMSSQFFTSIIQNGLAALDRQTIGFYFKLLFKNLFDFMFDSSEESDQNFNVVNQVIGILKNNDRLNNKETDIMILGANLESLYVSYHLKKYGIKSVTLAAKDDEELFALNRCLTELNKDIFEDAEDFRLNLINLKQPNYKFAAADIFINLVVGCSGLKTVLVDKIKEVRLTPKLVAYASFYKDEQASPFEEYKLNVPILHDEVQSEERLEAIRLAAENSYKLIFN